MDSGKLDRDDSAGLVDGVFVAGTLAARLQPMFGATLSRMHSWQTAATFKNLAKMLAKSIGNFGFTAQFEVIG